MTKQTDITAKLTELGFALEIKSGPTGKFENDWPAIAFGVALLFKGKLVLETEYSLGIGHVDIKKARPDSIMGGWTSAEQSMLYAWHSNPSVRFKDEGVRAKIAAKLAKQQGVRPELDSVVHSLLMDGEAFFNAQSFEDWAGDFGYDSDSRKAEAIYRACDSIGRKLSAHIPKTVLGEARELTQDI